MSQAAGYSLPEISEAETPRCGVVRVASLFPDTDITILIPGQCWGSMLIIVYWSEARNNRSQSTSGISLITIGTSGGVAIGYPAGGQLATKGASHMWKWSHQHQYLFQPQLSVIVNFNYQKINQLYHHHYQFRFGHV